MAKLDTAVEQQTGDERVLDRVVGYYHETLKESPEALVYLASRGLRSTEMIERFRLGFANRTETKSELPLCSELDVQGPDQYGQCYFCPKRERDPRRMIQPKKSAVGITVAVT